MFKLQDKKIYYISTLKTITNKLQIQITNYQT
jgi:hypothetical protein